MKSQFPLLLFFTTSVRFQHTVFFVDLSMFGKNDLVKQRCVQVDGFNMQLKHTYLGLHQQLATWQRHEERYVPYSTLYVYFPLSSRPVGVHNSSFE